MVRWKKLLTQRFKTEAEAQSYADEGLRAQRIYRTLKPLESHPRIRSAVNHS